jgi:hypothetical protein
MDPKVKKITIFIILLWIGVVPLLYLLTNKWDGFSWDVSSKIGDSFGVINSLFSGAALIGVIYTIFIQRDSLQKQQNALDKQQESINLQRKEIEESIAIQREAIEAQKKALELQLRDLEQAAAHSARTSLMESYSRHIEWYYAERQKRIEKSESQMTDDDFQALFSNIEKDFKNYQRFVKEIETSIMTR